MHVKPFLFLLGTLFSFSLSVIAQEEPVQPLLLRKLQSDHETIKAAVVFRDRPWLAVGGDTKNVRIFDTTTGNPLHELHAHKGTVRALALAPTKPLLASAGDDGMIFLWEVGEKIGDKPLHALTYGDGPIQELSFSSDGKLLISINQNLWVRGWKEPTDTHPNWEGIDLRKPPGDYVNLALLSPSPTAPTTVLSIDSLSAFLWDAKTGNKTMLPVPPKQNPIFSTAAYSSDGNQVALGTTDGLVFLYEVRVPTKPKLLKTWRAGNTEVHFVTWDPNNLFLLGIFKDNGDLKITDVMALWNTTTGTRIATWQQKKPVFWAGYSANKRFVLLDGYQNKLIDIDPATNLPLTTEP